MRRTRPAVARPRDARQPAIPEASRPLPRAFYARDARTVARDLLGRVLVHDGPGGRVSGRIVEVEAYGGERDLASHARPGRTARNAAMYGAPGHAYVYFIYGVHWCFNVVVERAGRPSAVLVRALEPRTGIARMARRRGTGSPARLTAGPGCVGDALALDGSHDGADLTRGRLWISSARARVGGERIRSSRRIGIRLATKKPWRFSLETRPLHGSRAEANAQPRATRGPVRLRRRLRR